MSAEQSENVRILVYGPRGWIGKMVIKLLEEKGLEVYPSTSRLEIKSDLSKEIEKINPNRIINCAGLTGRPNIDWCEDHKIEVVETNVIGVMNLVNICYIKNIHLTNLATGCIYEYDQKHPIGSGIGFTEKEQPNFTDSFYSYTKDIVEKLIYGKDQDNPTYPNVLTLRLRMPISDALDERSFLTKISKYQKVVNVPNSMSVLYDLLPILIDMSITKKVGIYNFVNPGVISHNELLDLYKEYIDPDFVYTNFSLEEQAMILKAGRSNNELDTSKLLREYPEIMNIKESIIKVFERMRYNMRLI